MKERKHPMPLLQLVDLKTTYRTEKGNVKAVDGVSFRIERGMNYGLVGESGCGKSTLVKSIIACLPPNAFIAGGQVFFEGNDLTSLDDDILRKIRWKQISMITQSAMNALDPVYSVGSQIVEAIQTHEKVGYSEAKERVEKMFALVGIEKNRFSNYPHQFSGGMRQRSIIAMALILEPSLVIADEPTTALDVIVQDQIFKKIRELQTIIGFSMLLVTHDIAVVIENCGEIAVMYGGKMLELGDIREVIDNPFHPYTMGLKNSFPNIRNRHNEPISIPGFPPNLIGDLVGCRFYLRCPFSFENCSLEEPKMTQVGKNHYVACHNIKNADEIRERAEHPETWKQKISLQ
jgi:oligopeptide/dipeptide ABC transporter ATP-binding protein